MSPISELTILITGSTDGLGKHIARDLAADGAEVILHGRRPEKGRAVLAELRDATGSDRLSYRNADFAELGAVRRLADEVLSAHERLDVLVNNAGIGFGAPGSGRETSRDGHELRFQVNYLSGFLLTLRLLPLLQAAPAGRVINVASGAQQAIDFEDVMLETDYSGYRAYSQSKLAQIMFTAELAERFGDRGVETYSLHPATYMDTNMVREADLTPTNAVGTGARAVERLIRSNDIGAPSGSYFNGTQPARPADPARDGPARRRLWEVSEALTAPPRSEES